MVSDASSRSASLGQALSLVRPVICRAYCLQSPSVVHSQSLAVGPIVGLGNGSQTATSVVVNLLGTCCYQIFNVLKLLHFATDRLVRDSIHDFAPCLIFRLNPN